ncbi:MAG: MFS transporter [Candidatus Aenigmatarchaeota archaeon]
MLHGIIHNIHRAFKTKEELKEIYLTTILNSIAIALVGIFIPVYLFQSAFYLNEVALFMIAFWITLGLFSLITAKIVTIIGPKHTITLSIPFTIVHFILLVIINDIPSSIFYAIAVLGGIGASLYWIPLNSEFIKSSDKIHEGEEIGHLLALPRIAAIMAPVFGGIILVSFGFPTLFLIAIFFLIVCVLPLFITKDYKRSFHFTYSDMRFSLDKRLVFLLLVNGSVVMSDYLLWTLYIFIHFTDFILLGVASSFAGVGVAIFTLFIGKLTDKYDRGTLLKIGAIAYAFVWFGRMFATTQFEILTLSLLGGMFYTFIPILSFAMFCDVTRDKNILRNTVVRELWLAVGRVLPIMFLLIIVPKFIVGFAVAGILVALLVFIDPKKIK